MDWLCPCNKRLRAVEDKLTLILDGLTRLNEGERLMATALDSLTTQVAANVSLEGSIVQLLTGIAAQLAAALAANDTAALQALQQQLATSAVAVAAAIQANTPVSGTPAP